jgi:2-polyprenyl-6-methoxyphenol hydroxylase-like FAD-dependent oxidoreductase
LVREITAAEPGVDLALGCTAQRLLREDGAFQGVVVRDRNGSEAELRGRLVVGADGRASGIAELAGLPSKTLPHERIAYGAYFEGRLPANAPDATLWFLDPDVAVANPTDDGLVFYGALPTKARMAEFKRDPEAALVSYIAALPEAPPIHESTQVGPVIGKVDMPNRMRGPIGPGLALVGDAALATDPVFGVGCGWAFQSSEWLAESIAPALRGEEALDRGLSRYRRRHRRELRSHTFVIHDFATGRRLNLIERLLMRGAAHDPEVAARFKAFGSRQPKTGRALAAVTPRILVVNARQALSRRPGGPAQTAPDQT